MMSIKTNEELSILIDKATSGDEKSLETIIASVQDLVFNLSLRMLGVFPDAEDATQEILLKVITHLSSFKKESSFSTWVFSIASNHLKNYKKSMFAQHPLSFEYYGYDIENGAAEDLPDLTQDIEKSLLAEELKCPAPTSCCSVLTLRAGASSSWEPCSRWTAALRARFWALRRKLIARGFPECAKRWRNSWRTTAESMGRENASVKTGSITQFRPTDCSHRIWRSLHQKKKK
ncbi:MAG: RNA polymerase sigma factor [Emergencia timonensis]